MTVIRLTELGQDEDGAFRVRVSFGDEAEYRVTVTDPSDETREKRLAWYFEEHLRYPFLDKDLEQAAVRQIIDYGESLFEQVFGGETSHDYKNLRAHSFDECRIEVSGLAALHRLHWEMLRDPALDTPLAVRMPVTRRVSDQPSKFALPDARPTLNILIVTARPDGPHDVGYRTISRPLLDALRMSGLPVTIDLVRPGTWDALCNHLRTATERRGSGWYHVVHFDMHGAFAEHRTLEAERKADRLVLSAGAQAPFEGRRGFLFFETVQERQAEPVSADRVASLLAEHRVPVAVLNACQSAMQSDSEAGLAQRIAEAGVPVSVGMAYSVTVSAAERVMPVLYRLVADGADLATAVTAVRRDLQEHPGRQAYFGQELRLEDWMLPVMFSQRPLQLGLKPMTDQELAAFYERQAAVVHEPANEYGFVGRDLDIQVIERRLLTSTGNELLVQGMAGAGKSTLLRHLAWWWQRTGLVGEVFAFSYEDRAWTSAQIIREIQARLLTKVDQARAETMPEPAQLEQAAHLLRANQHLLILDNAESITATPAAIPHALDPDEQDHIKTLLSRLRGGKTLVLIGSREAETWLAPESFSGNRYSLPGLDRQAASTLVHLVLDRHSATRWLTDDAERDALDTLMKLLGGYPLPMTVVLPVLADAAPSAVLADLRTGGTGSDPAGQITHVIEYSHGKLDPGLQASLLLLAPFTAVIPTGPALGHYRDLLLRHPAVLANGPIDFAGAVAEAVRVGLATPHPQLKSYVQVQPVLPYFLRSRLRQHDDVTAAVNQAHYQLYAGLSRSLLDPLISEGDPQRRALGQIGMRAEYANLTAALNHGLATGQAIGTLIEPLEEYLDQTKQQTARRILLDDAITRYPQPTNNSQKRQLASLRNLAGHAAIAQHRLGDAQAHHEIELQFLEETGDRRQQGYALHQLGRVAQQQRQFDKADASYRKALDILLELGDRRTAAMTFHGLATVAQAQDRFEEAEASYRKALEIKLEFGDRLSAAMTFDGLATVAQAQDRFEEAEASYRKALDIKLEFGDQHAAATTYHNLGAAALKQGRLEEAEANYRKALGIYLGPGEDRYRAAKTQHSLASLALKQGRLEEAEASYRNALDIFAQFGDEHSVAEIYGQLGGIAEKQRRYDEAETSYREALDIFAQIGSQHSDWDRVRNRLLGYYLHMASAADLHLQPLPGMAVPEEFANRASAFAWLDAKRPGLVAAVAMAANTGRDLIAMRLAFALAQYFDRRRHYDDLLATANNGLEAARRLGDRYDEALALGNTGLALRELRRFEEAITAHTEAIAIFDEAGDRRAKGVELNYLGLALQEVRRFDEAIAAHHDAAAIFRETGDLHLEGNVHNYLGLALQGAQRFDEAITTYHDAAAIFRETGDRRREGNAYYLLGLALQGAQRFDEAIVAHQDAAAIFRETGDLHRESAALNNAGEALATAGRFDEAIVAHHDAAAIFRETGDRHGEGIALHYVGAALQEVRRFEQAIAPYQDAVEIFRENGDRKAEGRALIDLGAALLRIRRLDDAGTALHAAAGIFAETGDRDAEGLALNNLGVALGKVQRFDEAITAHKDAAARYQEGGNRGGVAAALTNLGSALQEVRRFDEAIVAHKDAAAIFGEIGDRHSEGIALRNLEAARAGLHA